MIIASNIKLFICISLVEDVSEMRCYQELWQYLIKSNCSLQFLEVIKLENMAHYRDDMIMPSDIFLLQVSIIFCSINAPKNGIFTGFSLYFIIS